MCDTSAQSRVESGRDWLKYWTNCAVAATYSVDEQNNHSLVCSRPFCFTQETFCRNKTKRHSQLEHNIC